MSLFRSLMMAYVAQASSTVTEIPSSEADTGDVCLYSKKENRLLIVSADDINKCPANKYSPVGVVVIPGSHNVYGDGSCGVMSLKEMDYNTPDTGSISYKYMFWGQNNVDISNMTNYNKVCYVGSNGSVNKDVQGVTNAAYLPSDKFTTVQNPYDKDTYFYYNNSYYYAPSPYNEDDTRNAAYYQTSSPSSSKNAMSDFDGIGNTTKLINLATAQSDWKSASTIINNYYSGYSPAACCCWRYHTDGTEQGNWYLPAMGELGYIMPKLKKINQAINTLISAYGSGVGVQVDGVGSYWSSSECTSLYAHCVYTDYGNVNYRDKSYDRHVRAFLRVGNTSSIPQPTITWAIQSGSWTQSSNSSAQDGKQFTSVSPGSSGSTVIRCTFSGVTSITFNCVYNGENNYDYLTVGALDTACTRFSYGTSLKGTSGTAKDITFTCDTGEHYVEFCYSKDGSVDTSPDCAVVYIKQT